MTLNANRNEKRVAKPVRAFSDIRTELIVLDARFDLLRRSLQVLPYLETEPHFEHGGVALAYAFEERSAAALNTELAEDW